MAIELAIINGNRVMMPKVLDGIDVEWSRQGAAGQMTFTVLKTENLSFVEGNAVTLSVDGVNVFYGFVTKKSRDKEQQIQVTCLDQLFYLAQNQTVFVAKNETASDCIKRLAKERDIAVGNLENTGYVIPKHRIDSATSYLDIMQTLLDITLAYSGKMFVLYDDFGKLTVKNVESMANKEIMFVTQNNAENFDYESDIESSYNDVVLVQADKSGQLSVVAQAKDTKNMALWGNLTHFEILDKDVSKENAELKAKQLLELHNQVKRKLSISGVFSNPAIRGGSTVAIVLNLGDTVVSRNFIVESVKHHFANDHSTMDLEVKSNGGFVL